MTALALTSARPGAAADLGAQDISSRLIDSVRQLEAIQPGLELDFLTADGSVLVEEANMRVNRVASFARDIEMQGKAGCRVHALTVR